MSTRNCVYSQHPLVRVGVRCPSMRMQTLLSVCARACVQLLQLCGVRTPVGGGTARTHTCAHANAHTYARRTRRSGVASLLERTWSKASLGNIFVRNPAAGMV